MTYMKDVIKYGNFYHTRSKVIEIPYFLQKIISISNFILYFLNLPYFIQIFSTL